MAFRFTRSDLKTRINKGIHGKIGMLIDSDETVNSAVRQAVTDIDFSSSIREQKLTPNLFGGKYTYPSPEDLFNNRIIDLPEQSKRYDGEFSMVTPEEFLVRPRKGDIAFDESNGDRLLYIYSEAPDVSVVVSTLDDTSSGGGLWEAFGGVGSVSQNTSDYTEGGASLSYTIGSSSNTTAGIVNSSLDEIDLSDYFNGDSSLFVDTYINSTTGVNSFTIRIGTSSSNYYHKTVTSKHDGTEFVSGVNTLRFDLTNLSSVGTPSTGSVSYIAVYMNKETTKVSETGYYFDNMKVVKGIGNYIKYYSDYGWVSSAGAYKADSTSDTDIVVANNSEYELIVQYGIKIAAKEVREYEIAKDAQQEIDSQKKKYILNNPSRVKVISTEYYSYGTN